MRKLNFEEYLECLEVLGVDDNPLKLYDYLKEEGDPNIDDLSDETAHELIEKIRNYIEEPISAGQRICIGLSLSFGIPFNQLEQLPKEVGVYLMGLYTKREQDLKPKPKSIGEQIQDAKAQMDKGKGNGVNMEQIAALLQVIVGNK
jgi:hypothetical protein